VPIRVASAAESAALDTTAIDAGIPSRALMRVAGANAASVIAHRYAGRLRDGVTIYTGPGNNGGDGWVVARSLASAGIDVHVCEIVSAKSMDAVAEREAAIAHVTLGEPPASGVVIDALLGTGARGALQGPIAEAVKRINAQHDRGAYVVALDVPTGLDATTGAHDASIVADLTITFGTCKRGHLVSRDVCGEIVVVDIGIAPTVGDTLPTLVDAQWVAAHLPRIPFDAHKGIRKKLVVIAGGKGMGGAAILAADSALRSGVGMVKVITQAENVSAVQSRLPEALTSTLPLDDASVSDVTHWGDAILMGPGLGHERETRDLVEYVLRAWSGPIVLDADALNVFPDDTSTLADLLHGRPAIITPHVVEFARLTACDVRAVLNDRFDIATNVAQTLHAAVLLKGTPTVVTAPDGTRLVSASGTAALGTGGSGDVLGGMVATLLAQGCEPAVAAACGAWVHGRAAELCQTVRGVTLQDILGHLTTAWRPMENTAPAPWRGDKHRRAPDLSPRYPVLADLPKLT